MSAIPILKGQKAGGTLIDCDMNWRRAEFVFYCLSEDAYNCSPNILLFPFNISSPHPSIWY